MTAYLGELTAAQASLILDAVRQVDSGSTSPEAARAVARRVGEARTEKADRPDGGGARDEDIEPGDAAMSED